MESDRPDRVPEQIQGLREKRAITLNSLSPLLSSAFLYSDASILYYTFLRYCWQLGDLPQLPSLEPLRVNPISSLVWSLLRSTNYTLASPFIGFALLPGYIYPSLGIGLHFRLIPPDPVDVPELLERKSVWLLFIVCGYLSILLCACMCSQNFLKPLSWHSKSLPTLL